MNGWMFNEWSEEMQRAAIERTQENNRRAVLIEAAMERAREEADGGVEAEMEQWEIEQWKARQVSDDEDRTGGRL